MLDLSTSIFGLAITEIFILNPHQREVPENSSSRSSWLAKVVILCTRYSGIHRWGLSLKKGQIDMEGFYSLPSLLACRRSILVTSTHMCNENWAKRFWTRRITVFSPYVERSLKKCVTFLKSCDFQYLAKNRNKTKAKQSKIPELFACFPVKQESQLCTFFS